MEAFTHVEDRLLSRMKELGLKQLDICQKTGLSTTAVSNYCTGKRLPDTLSLYKIASVLDVSMEWILTGGNETNEELSQMEADLIDMLRLLDERDCGLVLEFVALLYKKSTGKMGSIYSTYTADELKRTSEPGESGESQSGIA